MRRGRLRVRREAQKTTWPSRSTSCDGGLDASGNLRSGQPKHRGVLADGGPSRPVIWSCNHMYYLPYYKGELGCCDCRRVRAGVRRAARGRADRDSGVVASLAAVRSTAWAASGGHAQRLGPREHEGTAVQCDDGQWRVAFAFDTKRKAVLLVAGDKSGGSEKRFYRRLIHKADERFDAHLARLKKEGK